MLNKMRVRFSMSHEESLTGSSRFRDSKLCSGRSQFFGLVSHGDDYSGRRVIGLAMER